MAKKRASRTTRATAKKKAAPRKRKPVEPSQEAGKSPESAFQLTSEKIESALLADDQTHLLEEYFGEEQLQELRQLAAQAQSRSTRGGPRVLILPGIMGSSLGLPGTFFDDTIWIGPSDIVRGNLSMLSLQGGDPKVKPLGVIQFAYLQMKLRLKIAGFNADFFPFDWRLSIDKLGSQLAAQIRKETEAGSGTGRARPNGRSLSLVAHSMGGLVARAALSELDDGAAAVQRLVMLGTPNYGSFVPVQALRGEYSVVQKVAAADLVHDAKQLTETVFNTFPGLYQLLPFPEKYSALDLYNPSTWPATAPRPRTAILNAVRAVQQKLAPGSDRMSLIAGVDQDTVTNLQMKQDDFEYLITQAGDGTVPLEFAKLENVSTWYVPESHGNLPNNGQVIRATINLLETGATSELPQDWTPRRRSAEKSLEPAPEPFDGRTGNDISRREMRHLMSELAAPMKPTTVIKRGVRTEAVASELSQEPIVVGRRRQQRIDIFVARGDVTQVDSRAVVLGLFNDVAPSGAADAFDKRLGGVITEFTERRMFSGNVGEIFMMPAGRQQVRTEMLVFAGMGSFDMIDGDVLRLVAQNAARTLISTGVSDFATVVLGGSTAAGIRDALSSLVDGFLAGIKDADKSRRMRSITICENDPDRYEILRRELLHLATTPIMDDVEITVEPILLPQSLPTEESRRGADQGPEPCYLFVHRQTATFADPEAAESSGGTEEILTLQSSILTPTGKGTVVTDDREIDQIGLRRHLESIEMSSFNNDRIEAFGTTLAEMLLPESIRTLLKDNSDHPLVVIHDAEASRMPWETICINKKFPVMEQGLSRKYAAENLSVAKWLEERRISDILNILLVINPTGDLPGAKAEGAAVAALMANDRSIQATTIEGDQATWTRLRSELRSGKYDVLHYAGHAFFDPTDRSRSGLICNGGRVLSGADLAGIGGLPALAFINGCEAARIRSRTERDGGRASQERIEKNVSLAEAFLRGGIANYLGTYWPVGDAAALTFSKIFYHWMLQRESIASALLKARQAVLDVPSVDWADYIHYGSPNFQLKK